MRVLHITNMYPSEERPGWGAFIKSQIDSLSEIGVDTSVLVIDGYKSRFEYLRGVRRLRDYLKSDQPYDLIHAHYGLSGFVARSQFKLPVLLSYCGDDLYGHCNNSGKARLNSLPVAYANRSIGRFVDEIIVKSERMKGLLPIACQRKTHIVPNGVNLEVFRPGDKAAARQALGLDANIKYVLFPYNPDRPRKNFALAKAAIERANQDFDSLVKPLTIFEKDLATIVQAMQACDALVLASHWEGSPNVVKEAMAVGLPVVSGDVGDVRERLAGVDGSGVYPHTVETFAAGLKIALQTNTPNNGPVKIRTLSTLNTANRIHDIYKHICDSRVSKGNTNYA